MSRILYSSVAILFVYSHPHYFCQLLCPEAFPGSIWVPSRNHVGWVIDGRGLCRRVTTEQANFHLWTVSRRPMRAVVGWHQPQGPMAGEDTCAAGTHPFGGRDEQAAAARRSRLEILALRPPPAAARPHDPARRRLQATQDRAVWLPVGTRAISSLSPPHGV